MSHTLDKLISECRTGARSAQTLQDDLETMFEMWTGYMTSRLGESVFLDRLVTYDDPSFNIDGYQPTIMPVTQGMIDGMTSIGVDVIKPNPRVATSKHMSRSEMSVLEVVGECMAIEDAKTLLWLIFTVVEQGHPLKGLRYIAGFRDGELVVGCDDPLFTETYDDEHVHIGCLGIYIDKRERFLRAVRRDIFND